MSQLSLQLGKKVVSQPGIARFCSYQEPASESQNKTPLFSKTLNNRGADWKDAGCIAIKVCLPKKESGHERSIQACPKKRNLGKELHSCLFLQPRERHSVWTRHLSQQRFYEGQGFRVFRDFFLYCQLYHAQIAVFQNHNLQLQLVCWEPLQKGLLLVYGALGFPFSLISERTQRWK